VFELFRVCAMQEYGVHMNLKQPISDNSLLMSPTAPRFVLLGQLEI
jgi:hypothetical protein